MKRIVITGSTGTGKSTLGLRLGEKLGVPVADLDDLNWRPGWTASSDSEFMAGLDAVMQDDRWIVIGNYGNRTKYVHWEKADTLIWLDYGFFTTLGRLLARSGRRIIDKKPICNGNYETLHQLFSKDSIVLWLFRSYWRRKREIPSLLQQPRFSHLNILVFRTPGEADAFLKSVHS